MKLALDGVFSFSDVPLRVATWIGFIGMLGCLTLVAFIIYEKVVVGVSVQGWASLVLIVLLLGSLHLMILGVLGQYVGRMYEELKGRPLYVVHERIGFRDEHELRQR